MDRFEEKYYFCEATLEDAAAAGRIEAVCFPPNEACQPDKIRARIEQAPAFFLLLKTREEGKLIGFLNGLATDEERFRDEFFTDASLHRPDGAQVMLLGLDVLPEYRHQGLASALMREYQRRQRACGRKSLILTCHETLLNFYRSLDFEDEGMSGSAWGGSAWHEMRCEL